MLVQRRDVLRLLAWSPLGLSLLGDVLRRRAQAQSAGSLALRKVVASDAAHLQAIMNSCVTGADPFHGRCNPWSAEWADKIIRLRPDSLVITMDGVPVAFHDVTPARAATAPLRLGATNEEREKYALREQNRSTLRITAAGVRADVLSPEEAVRMFRRILYYGGRAARRLGYERAECFAPWVHHPKMSRAWTDYPSCEVLYASRNQADGRDFYWLRWRLDDVTAAFAAEGADDAQLDIA